MELLVALQVAEAPEHPVLPRAERYDVRALRFSWDMTESASVELDVSTHEEYVRLRFTGVEGFQVAGGELIGSLRLRIQDTSQCPSRTRHIPAVRVGGVESQGNALCFWAEGVERV